MEYVGKRIARLPPLREVRNDVHLRVVCQKGIENQTIQMLRLRVGADARIKIRRHRFDQEVNGARLFGARDSTNNPRQLAHKQAPLPPDAS